MLNKIEVNTLFTKHYSLQFPRLNLLIVYFFVDPNMRNPNPINSSNTHKNYLEGSNSKTPSSAGYQN